jgi:hypothetical protein
MEASGSSERGDFSVNCGKVSEKFGWFDYFNYFCSGFISDYYELI